MKVLWIMLIAMPVFGASYYVATDGDDDTGDGSIGNPWRNIRKGCIAMSGGDTLFIRAGVYDSDGFLLEEIQSGTGASYTTICNYPGEAVTYAPTVASHGILLSDKTNVFLHGFSVDGSAGALYDVIKITTAGASVGGNVIISNMTLFGIPRGHGILTSSIDASKSILISHCNFYTNGWNGQEPDSPLHQIYIQDSNVTVENCYIWGGTNSIGGTTGIQAFNSGCTNWIFRNNYFTNTHDFSILASSSGGGPTYIYENIISSSPSGVGIRVEHIGTESYVLNNTIYGVACGIVTENATNCYIENNLLTGLVPDSRGALYLLDSSNVFVRNNLVCSNLNQFQDYITNGTVSVTYSDNLIARTQWATNEIYDPGLVNPAVGNFTLTAASDAIDAGRTQTIFTTAYAGPTPYLGMGTYASGATWSGTWEIGAFQYEVPSVLRVGTLLSAPK